MAGKGLAAGMASSNGWAGDKAQELLIGKNDKTALAMLANLAGESKSTAARIQAAWTLQGLGELDAATLRRTSQDAHAPVRREALRIVETRPADESAQWLSLALKMVHDT